MEDENIWKNSIIIGQCGFMGADDFYPRENRFRFYASAFILLNIILSMYQVRLFMYFNAAYLSFYIGAFMLCGF